MPDPARPCRRCQPNRKQKMPTPSRLIARIPIPLLDQLRHVSAADALTETLAGAITAILIIPQAIAYALLAGLPPQTGLYAAIVAPIVYALTGSSRTVIIGPAAVQAVMVAAALVPLADAAASVQVAGALMLGLISGAMLLALGLLRMGWLTHFISNPVLSGFTTGAVLYIIVTQLGTLLGIAVPRDGSPLDALLALSAGLPGIQVVTAGCGLAAIALLMAARSLGPAVAVKLGSSAAIGAQAGRVAPLLIVLLFTLISAGFALARQHGVAVVGAIPSSLPTLSLSLPVGVDWRSLAPGAVLIGLVGYIETLSVAKALAFKRRERIDPDRELVALGVTNIAVAALSGMPVAGSFSKSMVNFDAGARTQLAGFTAAILVALCALLFTGFLHELPRTVLAAIIIVAVLRLVDFQSLKSTWRYDRGDGLAQAVTIVGVLVFGIEAGLLIGSGLAVALFLYKTSRPRILVVGHVPGTEHFRGVHRNDVVTFDHLLMIRIDENLYFANTPRVETELQRLVAEHPRASNVVLILSGIGYIDASSLDMLDNFERELAKAGTRLHLTEPKHQVIDRLRNTELFERLGPDRIHRSTFDLVASFDAGLF